MAYQYLFDPNKQFQNVSGVNNVAGFLRVFYNGTDDRAVTYKDFNGTANPADIPIDNNGRAVVIADEDRTYRLEVYSRDGSMLWSQYPLVPASGGGNTGAGAVLTIKHQTNRFDSTKDVTLGTFVATGSNKTITIPKDAYCYQIGTNTCFWLDVLNAYLSGAPVFAEEVYSWYEGGKQKQDLYIYTAMKQYWGDNSFYDGTSYIQFFRIDSDANKIVVQKCKMTPGQMTGYAIWEKTEIPFHEVFYADVCVTPFADIKAAYDRGDFIMGKSGGDFFPLYKAYLGTSYSDSFSFACLHGDTWYEWTCYQNSTGYEATHGWATPPGMVLFPERANIADEYSNQRTYAFGDLCYNGSLYRCTTAIPTPENWTAAHWTATSMNAELALLRSTISSLEARIAALGG